MPLKDAHGQPGLRHGGYSCATGSVGGSGGTDGNGGTGGTGGADSRGGGGLDEVAPACSAPEPFAPPKPPASSSSDRRRWRARTLLAPMVEMWARPRPSRHSLAAASRSNGATPQETKVAADTSTATSARETLGAKPSDTNASTALAVAADMSEPTETADNVGDAAPLRRDNAGGDPREGGIPKPGGRDGGLPAIGLAHVDVDVDAALALLRATAVANPIRRRAAAGLLAVASGAASKYPEVDMQPGGIPMPP